jgi:hypothetical protein
MCDTIKFGQVVASSGDRLVLSGGAESGPEYVKLGSNTQEQRSAMTSYTSKLDMSTVPDDVLYAEVGRRRVAKRPEGVGGRPAVLRPCPHCGHEFGARDLRAHLPHCSKRR